VTRKFSFFHAGEETKLLSPFLLHISQRSDRARFFTGRSTTTADGRGRSFLAKQDALILPPRRRKQDTAPANTPPVFPDTFNRHFLPFFFPRTSTNAALPLNTPPALLSSLPRGLPRRLRLADRASRPAAPKSFPLSFPLRRMADRSPFLVFFPTSRIFGDSKSTARRTGPESIISFSSQKWERTILDPNPPFIKNTYDSTIGKATTPFGFIFSLSDLEKGSPSPSIPMGSTPHHAGAFCLSPSFPSRV